VRAQKSSDVVQFPNTGFLLDWNSAIKKFLENLSIGFSRVDWKVSNPIDRFSRNFFIAEIVSDYGQGRIDFWPEAKIFLKGRPVFEIKFWDSISLTQNFSRRFSLGKCLSHTLKNRFPTSSVSTRQLDFSRRHPASSCHSFRSSVEKLFKILIPQVYKNIS